MIKIKIKSKIGGHF